MAKPVVSVVLGTYNQKEILKRVLDAYQEQTIGNNFEVIVVDSSSTDGTAELLKTYSAKFSFKPIIQANKGKANARNRGVKEAASDLIIITDSDMIADPGFIKAHVDAHQDAEEKPLCFEGVTYDMAHLHWPPEKEFIHPYIKPNYPDRKKLGFYYFLTGNISFPKSVFEEAGGFSEDFLGYGWEDIELGYRLSRQKIPLYYLKSAINYHYHVVLADDAIDRHYAKGESARIMLQKHPKLSLYLGINPATKWVHRHIPKDGKFYNWMKKNYDSPSPWRHKIGHYFLKEHNYLRGLLGSVSRVE